MLAEAIQLVDEQLESSRCEIADVRRILADAVARLMRERCVGQVGADTVAALQFQDLSDQLLAHAMCRLEALSGEVRRVQGCLDVAPGGREPADWHWLASSVQRNLAAFTTSRNRPVATADLAPGDIEMF